MKIFFSILSTFTLIPYPTNTDIVEGHSIYLASLQAFEDHFCPSTIVSEKYLVTSENCCHQARKAKIEELSVLTGTQLLIDDVSSQRKKIKNLISLRPSKFHKRFPAICIIQIAENLVFDKNTGSIILSKVVFPTGTRCTSPGWDNSTSKSNKLRVISLELLDTDECKHTNNGSFTSELLCAGGSDEDMCHRFSGEPLICNNSLVGISSFDGKCGMTAKYYVDAKEISDYIRREELLSKISNYNNILYLLCFITFVIVLCFSYHNYCKIFKWKENLQSSCCEKENFLFTQSNNNFE